MQIRDIPRVLVLGATGRTGAAVATALEAMSGQAVPVRAARDRATVERWLGEGKDAVYIDLDDADTFPDALHGIDRMFLVAGYTSSMNHQAETLVDAAEDAGVGFVVHLGVRQRSLLRSVSSAGGVSAGGSGSGGGQWVAWRFVRAGERR